MATIINLDENSKFKLEVEEKQLFTLGDYDFKLQLKKKFEDTDDVYDIVFNVYEKGKNIDTKTYNIYTRINAYLEIKDILFYYHNFLKVIFTRLKDTTKTKEEKFLLLYIRKFNELNLLSAKAIYVEKLYDTFIVFSRNTDLLEKVHVVNIQSGNTKIIVEQSFDTEPFNKEQLVKEIIRKDLLDDDIVIQLI